jgi:hypothetical protein
MKKSTFAILVSAALCGACASQGPVEVSVPLPIPCDVPEPSQPVWLYDSATKEMKLAEKIRRMRAELRQREFYEQELRAALAACR